jgi:hypothetical protein
MALKRYFDTSPLGALRFPIPAASHRYFGIDFSGAKDAGRKIWLTEVAWDPAVERLRVVFCVRGEDLEGSARDRDTCLAALRGYVARTPNGVFGADFPFAVCGKLIGTDDWSKFASGFASTFSDAQVFRERCWRDGGNRELKRLTERESKTPFNPYNLRLYRQTFHGIRDFLAPLVRENAASVAPQQKRARYRAVVHEVCAACTLKRIGLYPPYKGKTVAHREARAFILRNSGRWFLAPLRGSVRQTVLDDSEGDALDSVIAATASFRAIHGPDTLDDFRKPPYVLEGRVFL